MTVLEKIRDKHSSFDDFVEQYTLIAVILTADRTWDAKAEVQFGQVSRVKLMQWADELRRERGEEITNPRKVIEKQEEDAH